MKLKFLKFGAVLLMVSTAAWLWNRARNPQLPPSTATTVANLRFGSGAGEIAQLVHLQHRENNLNMLYRAAPCGVDEEGRIFIVDKRNRLHTINVDGTMEKSIALPWDSSVVDLCYGPKQTLWMATVGPNSIIKANTSGKPLWQIGYKPVGDLNPKQIQSLSNPSTSSGKVEFNEIEGLFTTSMGDVFALDHTMVMRGFDSKGRSLATYDLELRLQTQKVGQKPKTYSVPISPPPNFIGAIAGRDGTVYSQAYYGSKKGVELHCWSREGRYTTRTINLDLLERTGGPHILLMGSDAAGNLYFQYLYNRSDTGTWNGPMAIAKVGKDNIARRIFDIYKHYKGNWTGRVGDIIHVSAKGDVYLELESGAHYRIDKISFSNLEIS